MCSSAILCACTIDPSNRSCPSSVGNYPAQWSQVILSTVKRRKLHASCSLGAAEKLFTAGEGGSGYCFRCEEISPVPVWLTIFYPFGHKPLQHIFKVTSAAPTMASARIQHWAIATTWRLRLYDCLSTWRAARKCRSVQPLSTVWNVPTPPETILVMNMLSSSPVTAAQIKQWTAREPLLSRVKDKLLRGGSCGRKDGISPYHKVWNELSIHDGCLLRGSRVIVPPEGREKVLDLLHEGHHGIVTR